MNKSYKIKLKKHTYVYKCERRDYQSEKDYQSADNESGYFWIPNHSTDINYYRVA